MKLKTREKKNKHKKNKLREPFNASLVFDGPLVMVFNTTMKAKVEIVGTPNLPRHQEMNITKTQAYPGTSPWLSFGSLLLIVTWQKG